MTARRIWIATLAAISLIAAQSAKATIISYWAFPATVPASADNFKIAFPIDADQKINPGPSRITTDALTWDGTAAPPASGQGNWQYFVGSTLLAQPSFGAGSGLSLRSGTAGASNGKSMTLQFDSTGYTGLQLDFAERYTTTGPSSVALSWSTDGVNFTNEPSLGFSTAPQDSTFRTHSIDLSSLTSLNNTATAYLRFTFSGFSTTSSTGAVRLDNITITPEPATLGLLGVGFVFLARRRR